MAEYTFFAQSRVKATKFKEFARFVGITVNLPVHKQIAKGMGESDKLLSIREYSQISAKTIITGSTKPR